MRKLIIFLVLVYTAGQALGTELSDPETVSPEETVQADEFFQLYSRCREKDDNIDRLICYDELLEGAERVDSAEFQQQKQALASVTGSDRERKRQLADQQLGRDYRRLASNDPNFFGYAHPTSDDIGDEPHLEYYISQKYALVEPWFKKYRYVQDGQDMGSIRPGRGWIPDRLYFIYNGQFDFYALGSDRYDSSPIISRIQNPGLTFEWDFADPREKLRIGYFHESNGQSLGPEDDDDDGEQLRELLEFNRKRDRHGEDFALAQVSRGWDYLSFRYEKSKRDYLADFDPNWYQFHVEYRHFVDEQMFSEEREDDIWWEQGNSADISDYDGLRLMGERAINLGKTPLISRIQYKGGVSSFDALGNASWRLSLGVKALNTRFTAFYFDGYGREPSTYHLRTRYWGVGLELR